MPDRTKPPTGWKKFWPRWGRTVIVSGLVVMVVLGVFVSIGAAALVFLLVLALATFGSGAPSYNGPQPPPSVPGTYPDQRQPGLFVAGMRNLRRNQARDRDR